MKNVYVYCEGPTEESFINHILQPYLLKSNIYARPIICTTSRKNGIKYKGGVSTYQKIKDELTLLCKQHHNELITTMFDYYALPKQTPGLDKTDRDLYKHITEIEAAVENDIGMRNLNFNLIVHEFEGLLFSQPLAFEEICDSETTEKLSEIRNSFQNPEYINNSTETAPSKRIISLIPDYAKVRNGTLIAKEIGIEKIRRECPHFDSWLSKIEI